MLQINNINYGLIPFGPANGQPAIQIDITETEGDWEKGKLFSDFKNMIEDKGLNQEYITAINGSLKNFLVFNGGYIEKENNYNEWDDFHIALSKDSVHTQTSLKLTPDKLKPPFCIWVGHPTWFTGKNNFYQYFNCAYAIVRNGNYAQLALQEIINHQFSTVCILSEVYKKIIKELLGKFNLAHKLIVVNDNNNEDKMLEYCLDSKLKYNFNSNSKQFLKF